MIFGPDSQLAIAHGPDFTAQRLLAHRSTKFFPRVLRHIAQTPTNHAVKIGCRPTLDFLRQGRMLLTFNRDCGSGAFPLIRLWGSRSLKRVTQSRTIWSVTLPRRAASERQSPLLIEASANRRRA